MRLYYDPSGNPVGDHMEWAKLLEKNRHVGSTDVGPYWVSTVFLGLDHGFGDGPPLIYETMVFKGNYSDLECERYSTYHEALLGHWAMVERYRNKQRSVHHASRVVDRNTDLMEVPE